MVLLQLTQGTRVIPNELSSHGDVGTAKLSLNR